MKILSAKYFVKNICSTVKHFVPVNSSVYVPVFEIFTQELYALCAFSILYMQ